MDKGFAKNLLTLITGTGLAQIISLLFVYLLTFFYTPLDYKDYAVFVGIVTIIGGVITLKYELVIPIVEKQEDAVNLVYLGFIITLVLSTLGFLTALLISLIFFDSLIIYVIIGSATVFFVGLYNILFHWALRKNDFKEISISRISQSTAGGLVHIVLGFIGFTKYGLPIGNFFNFNSGFFRLLRVFKVEKPIFNWSVAKDNLFKHKKYPLFSTLESIFLNGSQHVPIILIGFFYGSKAGIFVLCSRIMAAPVGLIGHNLQSLYLSEIGNCNNEDEIKKLTYIIINKTVIFGSIPILIISILGYFFADIFFPENWSGIGRFMIFISPWMNLSLVSKSFSIYYNYNNKQEINFYFNTILFASGVTSLILGNFYSFNLAIEFFCIVNFCIYLAYYVFSANRVGLFVNKVYLVILVQLILLLINLF